MVKHRNYDPHTCKTDQSENATAAVIDQETPNAAESPGFDRPSHIPWPPILLALAIATAVLLGYIYPVQWPGLRDLAARLVGLSIGAGGVMLAVWAIWTLRAARTTVLPHQGAEHLVTTGPFARLRNPIYVADVMVLLGIAELTGNIWFAAVAAAFAILVTFLAILPEERHLEARFGEQYRAYKSRSRRWL